jgi:hypothetical protein
LALSWPLLSQPTNGVTTNSAIPNPPPAK